MAVSILLLPQINPGFAAEKLVLAKHETQMLFMQLLSIHSALLSSDDLNS
jgi:hypothetical protein